VSGTNKVTYTPSGGGPATEYRDQTLLICKTEQIDVIANTQLLGNLKLITREFTPTSGPLKDIYIGVSLPWSIIVNEREWIFSK
jgi:hypothetical protein